MFIVLNKNKCMTLVITKKFTVVHAAPISGSDPNTHHDKRAHTWIGSKSMMYPLGTVVSKIFDIAKHLRQAIFMFTIRIA